MVGAREAEGSQPLLLGAEGLLNMVFDAVILFFPQALGIENEDDLIIPALEILSKDNSFVDPEAVREMIPVESNDISLSMRNGQR